MSKKIKSLFKAAVRYGGGGFGKNSARLGCKIPAAVCKSDLRGEYFVNATLRVVISLDPQLDTAPPLAGMEEEFESVELTVKVNQYSINDTDIGFSMTFGKTDMPATFLQSISHAAGSLYILSVTSNEDGRHEEADYDSEDSEDE